MPVLNHLLAAIRGTAPKFVDHRTVPLANSADCAEVPGSSPDITATPATEAWLDERAEDLNGEWTVARLAGLSRREGKAERRCALSSLVTLEELRLKPDPHGSYMDNNVQVFTMKGLLLGQLDPEAAALFHEQSNSSHIVRAYVYATQWAHNDCTGVLIALVTWVPFQRALTHLP